MEGVGQHREWVGAWSAPQSKNEGVVSEARLQHLTCKESKDVVSETRHPRIRKKMQCYIPAGVGKNVQDFNLLSHQWHGVLNEVLMDGHGLNVWGDNNHMFP